MLTQNSKNYSFFSLFFIIFLFSSTKILKSQTTSAHSASAIYSDFDGYWFSSATNVSTINPNLAHNLLAFTWNGTTFSTGVNDAILDNNNVTYTPLGYYSFPINSVTLPDQGSTVGGPVFIGVGSMMDGNPNTATWVGATPPIKGADILTRGTRGLDLGSCITNIPQQQLKFIFKNLINPSQFNDGIPDILITQMAAPDGTYADKVYFTKEDGTVIGNQISINQTTLTRLGSWAIDFFYPNGTVGGANQTRDMRLWAGEINDFGITSANYQDAKYLIYELGGSSDPAFLAYNNSVVSILKANNDQLNASKNYTSTLNIIANDLPQDGTIQPSNITITTNPSHGTASIDATNGNLIYTPTTDYVGADVLTYKITAIIGNQTVTSSANVIIDVNTYITTPQFASNSDTILCQATNTTTNNTYSAFSAYSTDMSFSLEPSSAGTLSTVVDDNNNNYSTTVTWSPSYSGRALLIATANGSDGPKVDTLGINVSSPPTLTLVSATGTDNQVLNATSTFQNIIYNVTSASNVTFTHNIEGSIDGTYNASTQQYTISNLQQYLLGSYQYSLTTIPTTISAACPNTSVSGTLKIVAYPLPVTWLYLKAIATKEKTILVQWSTASEQNTKSFIIQSKNENAADFKDIQTIPAAGNSSTPLVYSYTDSNISLGTNQYRIKQTDLDGKYTYSSIISVYISDFQNEAILLYPNPANDQAYLKAPANSDISVYDSEGRKVQVFIQYTGSQYQITTKSIKAGIHFIKVQNKSSVYKVKLIITH